MAWWWAQPRNEGQSTDNPKVGHIFKYYLALHSKPVQVSPNMNYSLGPFKKKKMRSPHQKCRTFDILEQLITTALTFKHWVMLYVFPGWSLWFVSGWSHTIFYGLVWLQDYADVGHSCSIMLLDPTWAKCLLLLHCFLFIITVIAIHYQCLNKSAPSLFQKVRKH